MSLLDAFEVCDRPPLCEPFFRWTGSKAPLRDTITRRLPERITGNYCEPFLGGGTIALALLSEPGRIAGAALLSDVNAELVITYACVRDCPEKVITALQVLIAQTSKDHYEQIRDREMPSLAGNICTDVRGEQCDPERAARFLYLLGAGYHGLWRENQSGKMNTPYGHGENVFSHPERIRAASRALTRARISLHDFETAIRLHAGAGDTVYADPPYIPRSDTAAFATYSSGGFGPAAHARLDNACKEAAQRGVLCLVSNSDTPETRRLYSSGKPEILTHNYRIGASTTGTDPARELLIKYTPRESA